MNIIRSRYSLAATLLASAALMPATVWAQGPATASAAGEVNDSASAISDIVVTARRREESLQSVPISVQAFSGETLAARNVQSQTDLQRLVPSLTTYSQARDEETLSIRGQSSSGASAQGQNPRVTAYFAEVPLQTGDAGGPGKFFDLQNVQVLKGPQGTLFGRNATGGAVLYEPQRPTQEFGGYVLGQIGRFDDREVEAAINLPVVRDLLAFRVSGRYAKRDGFTQNLTTGQDQDDRNYRAVRVSALLTPGDNFKSFLMFDYLKSDTNGSSQQLAGFDPNKVFLADILRGAVPGRPIPLTLGGNGPSLAAFSANPAANIPAAIRAGRVSYFPSPALENQLANQIAGGPRVTQSGVDGVSRTRSYGITNVSTLEIAPSTTIKNIFGYRRFKQLSRYDLDGTVLPLLDQTTPDGNWGANLRQITEELQLQGKGLDGKLDYTVGGFLLSQKSPSPQRTVQVSLGVPSLNISTPVERSQAAFVQGTYDLSELLTEGLSITGGYRYTHDYRRVTASNFRDPAGIFPAGSCGLLRGCPTVTKASFNASTYNLGIDWQVTGRTLLYVTHRRGYRAGGLNPQALDFGVKYDPEFVTDFEAGLKTDLDLGSMRGRFNAAVYASKLKGAQVSQSFSALNPLNNQIALINLIVNAASATIKGAELEFTLVPTEGLELSAAYAYTDAKYSSFVDFSTGLPVTGRPFPFQAKHRLNLGGRYTLPVPESAGKITLGVNWSYSTKYTVSVFADPLADENGYDQFDLRADWNGIAGGPISAALFVNNVNNEVYKIGGVPIYSVLGTTSLLYNEPRTWGLQLRYKFGENR